MAKFLVLHSLFLNALPLHTKGHSFTRRVIFVEIILTATGKVLRVIPEGQVFYAGLVGG